MSAIRKEVTVGGVRLILGDALEVLPVLDEPAAMLLTDPPYLLRGGGNTTREMGGAFSHGRYDNSGKLFPVVDWGDMALAIWPALRADADAIVMATDREEAPARAAFEAVGFGFHRLLVWDKGTATPNRWYMPNCEFGLYLWKGRARPLNDCGAKALLRVPQRDVSAEFLPDWVPADERHAHATEKPVELFRAWLVNSTAPGELVLDPFCGTGTTAVAAIQSGRRAVVIEQDPKWFEVAVARARDAQLVPGYVGRVKRAGAVAPSMGLFGSNETCAESVESGGVRS